MIRRFFTVLVFAGLVAIIVWNYGQIEQLKSTNAQLVAANAKLESELSRHKGHRNASEFVQPSITTTTVSPTQDAAGQLTKAEQEIRAGNIGNAVADCKAAASDIASASSSTSVSVKKSVETLQVKLNDIQQQTSALLHKMGA